MKVREIIIHNYKSIANDCILKVDKNVTTLVGASQSGKTNVLGAIEKFSTGEYQTDDICDFSSAGQLPPPEPNMPMITIIFDIEDESKEFEKISPTLISIKEIRVTRQYNGEYVFHLPGVSLPHEEISNTADNISRIRSDIDIFLNDVSKEWEDVDEEINEITQKINSFEAIVASPAEGEVIIQGNYLSESLESIKESFKSLIDSLVVEEEKEEEEGEETGEKEEEEGEETGENAEEPMSASELKDKQELEGRLDELMSNLEKLTRQYEEATLSSKDIGLKILNLIPDFIYVSAEYETLLKGEVNLNELNEAPENDVKFSSVRRLLRLANLDLSVLTTLNITEQRRLLRNSSSRVTEELQKIWGQQKVAISLALGGPNERQLRIWISNDGGPDRVPEHQSLGFRWFLEFYLSYALASGRELKRDVLLLDEAGIHLHPFAQRNLVDLLRAISTHNQIIHTTHLADTLDLENPERWRVVENNEQSRIGTQIINEAYQPREDSIGSEVIMRALWGCALVPALTLGPRNLIVEGPSDIIFLGTISRILARDKKEKAAVLINGEIAIFHTGGLSFYRRMLTFCKRPGLNTVALFDSDDDGKNTKQQLIKDNIIDKDKTIEINDVYAGNPSEERDLESIFGFSLMKEATMQVYKGQLPDNFDFKKDDLQNKGGLGRKFKIFFESQGIEEYDKTLVAEALKGILAEDASKLSQSSRDRFNALIEKIWEAFFGRVSIEKE